MKTNLSRRSILKTGTVLGVAPLATAPLAQAASSDNAFAAGAPLTGTERARKALQIRRTAALLQSEQQDLGRNPNGDVFADSISTSNFS